MSRVPTAIWVGLVCAFGALQGWANSTAHPPLALRILGVAWGVASLAAIAVVAWEVLGVARDYVINRGRAVTRMRDEPGPAAVKAGVIVVGLAFVVILLASVL